MTNKVHLREIDEFMSDYTPSYEPIYPLFMGKSQSYSDQVGKLSFKRWETVGDIRQKRITPKDTEMSQINVRQGTKSFNKYFLANQYIRSTLQGADEIEDVIAQVLDEHQKQADDLLITGEGTGSGDVLNNGLFHSADSNYTLKSSAAVTAGSDVLIDYYKKIMAIVQEADNLSGNKLLMFYGDTAISNLNAQYVSQPKAFRAALNEGLQGKPYSIAEMPKEVTPSGNGFIIANLDKCKLNYTIMPQLKDQGVNNEKMYTWHNFVMGSMMLDVLQKDAIIRQPLTFA